MTHTNPCGHAHRIDELEWAGCAACAWRQYHELIGVLAAIDRFNAELPERVRIILDIAAKDYQAFAASRTARVPSGGET